MTTGDRGDPQIHAGERSFRAELLATPIGVALLARLEAEVRDDVSWFAAPADVDPAAGERAVALVGALSFGQLLALALSAANAIGPWTTDWLDDLAVSFETASARAPIAAALEARVLSEGEHDVDLDRQEWWCTEPPRWLAARFDEPPLFTRFDDVYENGELTWAALRTATEPPPETHPELISAWEMFPLPISRWHLPVRTSPRIWEIHRPDDWANLVLAHPAAATRPHGTWALPGPNQSVGALSQLLAVPGQTAARTTVRRHLLPDWRLVSREFDAVHLSWAGFLTTEGTVIDLGDGDVTMLRFWGAERTMWLRDVFGDPEPNPEPVDAERAFGSANRATIDDARRGRDHERLLHWLGRPGP